MLEIYDDSKTYIVDEELENVVARMRAIKKPKYIELFMEIRDGAERCNNVSVLRSYADKAETLKIRLLNEMDAIDADLAKKKVKPDGEAVDMTIKVSVKKTRNVTIKNVTHTSSWRIERAEDVEKCVNQLKISLLKELDGNDIVNVEF